MRIINNIMAINAHRSYSINYTNVAKSVEKLSSGLKINRAGDDAAGLAISEKMRAQVKGLNMASKNAQDAISLVQTVEGALQEVHNVLQRMREIAVQAASDTNDSGIDRKSLDLEMQQLKAEITAIAEVTTFNGVAVLKSSNGDTNNYKIQAGPNASDSMNLAIRSLSLSSIGSPILQGSPPKPAIPPVAPGDIDYTLIGGTTAGPPDSSTSTGITADTSAADMLKVLDYLKAKDLGVNVEFKGLIAGSVEDMLSAVQAIASEGKTLGAGGFLANDYEDLGKLMDAAIAGIEASYVRSVNRFALDTIRFALQTNALLQYYGKLEIDTRYTLANGVGSMAVNPAAVSLAVAKQILSDAKVAIDMLSSAGLVGEAGSLSVSPRPVDASSVNVLTREDASFAINAVNDAINALSLERAQMGAYQNRLEHKIANLDTSAENLQDAESRIRDVDMAKEMTEFTRHAILAEGSTYIFAQTNFIPELVLNLLE